MGWVTGVIDDPPGFPYTPPGVDVLEGWKLTTNSVAGSSHDPLQSFALPAVLFPDLKAVYLLHTCLVDGDGCVFSTLSPEILT